MGKKNNNTGAAAAAASSSSSKKKDEIISLFRSDFSRIQPQHHDAWLAALKEHGISTFAHVRALKLNSEWKLVGTNTIPRGVKDALRSAAAAARNIDPTEAAVEHLVVALPLIGAGKHTAALQELVKARDAAPIPDMNVKFRSQFHDIAIAAHKQQKKQQQQKEGKGLPTSWRNSAAETGLSAAVDDLEVLPHGRERSSMHLSYEQHMVQLWTDYFGSVSGLLRGKLDGSFAGIVDSLFDLEEAILRRIPLLLDPEVWTHLLAVQRPAEERRDSLVQQLHTRFPSETEAKALALKNEGNASFGSGDFSAAIGIYKRGISLLRPSSPSSPPSDSVKQLLCALYSNMAQCHLFLHETLSPPGIAPVEGRIPFRTLDHSALAAAAASAALGFDPSHTKSVDRLLSACKMIRNEARSLSTDRLIRNCEIASGTESIDRNEFALQCLDVFPPFTLASEDVRLLRSMLHMNNRQIYRAINDELRAAASSFSAWMAEPNNTRAREARGALVSGRYSGKTFPRHVATCVLPYAVQHAANCRNITSAYAGVLSCIGDYTLVDDDDKVVDSLQQLALLMIRAKSPLLPHMHEYLSSFLGTKKKEDEFATLRMTVRLLNSSSGGGDDDDSNNNSVELLNRIRQLKSKGDVAFGAKDFKAAGEHYEKAIALCDVALAFDPSSAEVLSLVSRIHGNRSAASGGLLPSSGVGELSTAEEVEARAESWCGAFVSMFFSSNSDNEDLLMLNCRNRKRLSFAAGEIIEVDGDHGVPARAPSLPAGSLATAICAGCNSRPIVPVRQQGCGNWVCWQCANDSNDSDEDDDDDDGDSSSSGGGGGTTCPACGSATCITGLALSEDTSAHFFHLRCFDAAFALVPKGDDESSSKAWLFLHAAQVAVAISSSSPDGQAVLRMESAPRIIRLGGAGGSYYSVRECLLRAIELSEPKCGENVRSRAWHLLCDAILVPKLVRTIIQSQQQQQHQQNISPISIDSRVHLSEKLGSVSYLELAIKEFEDSHGETQGAVSFCDVWFNSLFGALSGGTILPSARDVEESSRRAFGCVFPCGGKVRAGFCHLAELSLSRETMLVLDDASTTGEALKEEAAQHPWDGVALLMLAASMWPDEMMKFAGGCERSRADIMKAAVGATEREHCGAGHLAVAVPVFECALPGATNLSQHRNYWFHAHGAVDE